ncbi:MAG: PPC domain-containing protein [Bacteroidota bacterium]
MHRFLLFLLALALALPAAAQDFSGSLDDTDDTRENDAYYETYTFEAEADDEVRVRMESSAFDTYLIVYGPTDEEYYNDDFEGTSVSQIEFAAPMTGTYTIWATSYAAESTGDYTVDVTTTAFVVAEEISGRLDPADKQSIKGEYFDSMTVTAPASGQFYVELRALGFDGYLRVVGPSGEMWRNDDYGDGGGYRLSRVGPLSGDGGQWQIDVTTYGTEEVGAYDIRVLTPGE